MEGCRDGAEERAAQRRGGQRLQGMAAVSCQAPIATLLLSAFSTLTDTDSLSAANKGEIVDFQVRLEETKASSLNRVAQIHFLKHSWASPGKFFCAFLYVAHSGSATQMHSDLKTII